MPPSRAEQHGCCFEGECSGGIPSCSYSLVRADTRTHTGAVSIESVRDGTALDNPLREAAAEIGGPFSRFLIEAGVARACGILDRTHALRATARAAALFEAWLDERLKRLPAAT